MADTLFIVPFQVMLWTLLHQAAESLWGAARVGILVGAVLTEIDQWMITGGLSSVIGTLTGVGDSLFILFGSIAVIVLGITYVMSAWGHVHVVDWRKALGWFAFGLLFYSHAPALYTDLENVRRGMGGAMYEALLSSTDFTAIQTEVGTAASGEVPMLPVADQFGDGASDGIDIALSYVLATGPETWQAASPGALPAAFDAVFFPPASGPLQFLLMDEAARADSLALAMSGLSRLLMVWPVIAFGVLEKLINILLGLAAGLLFIQMAVALPFALFVRTEVIARGLIDLWIELFIKTAVIGVFQAVGVTLVLIGAEGQDPAMALTVSLIGIFVMLLFLRAAARAIGDALNRTMMAINQTTGDRITQPTTALSNTARAVGTTAMIGSGILVAGAAMSAASTTAATASTSSAAAGASGASTTGAAAGAAATAAQAASLTGQSGTPLPRMIMKHEAPSSRRPPTPHNKPAPGALPMGRTGLNGIDTNQLAAAIERTASDGPRFQRAGSAAGAISGAMGRTSLGPSTHVVGNLVVTMQQAGAAQSGSAALRQVLSGGGIDADTRRALDEQGARAGVSELSLYIETAGRRIRERAATAQTERTHND